MRKASTLSEEPIADETPDGVEPPKKRKVGTQQSKMKK